MKTTSVSSIRSSFRDCLEAVRRGEEIVVTEHGRPVARILPVQDAPEPEPEAQPVEEPAAEPERPRGRFRKRRAGPLDMPIGRKGGVVLSALLE